MVILNIFWKLQIELLNHLSNSILLKYKLKFTKTAGFKRYSENKKTDSDI